MILGIYDIGCKYASYFIIISNLQKEIDPQ